MKEFADIDAEEIGEQFSLRNPNELLDAVEAYEGDIEDIKSVIATVSEQEDYMPWNDSVELSEHFVEEFTELFGPSLTNYVLRGVETIGVEQIRAEQEEKDIRTEVLIHAVKELPNTHTVNWECVKCGHEQKTTSDIPYQQPRKPGSCLNDECDVTAKKYLKHNSAERTHGFRFKVTEPNKLPSQDARIANVWVPLDDIALETDSNESEQQIGAILEGYGAEVEVTGEVHFKVDTTRGEVTNTQLWVLADEIKKSESELERIEFTDEDQQQVRDAFAEYEDERDFFDDYLAPEFIGRPDLKRAIAYTMATPLARYKKNGNIQDYGVGRLMIVGDPGTAKSKTTSAFLKSTLEELGAEKITAEYLSISGLGGTVTKSNDGFWEIDWGILPHVHRAGLVLDGMHQFSKKWLSKLREIMEESVIKIVKAAKGETDCASRIVGIANTNLYPIKDHYPTNYQASFDIGIGSEDDTNKLSGADRRRWDLIWVVNDGDVKKSDIDEHLFDHLSGPDNTIDSELWNKLWAWIWNLEYDDYDWAAIQELKLRGKEILNQWRNEYPNVDLPVTGNKGARILSSYVMSSAALHCRTNEDGKISPTEEDLENVKELFEDMFQTLELEKYERKQAQKEGIASAIHRGIMQNIAEAAEGKEVSLPDEKKLERHENLVSIIETIGEDPTRSMEEVAKQVGVTRKTVYNRLNMELELDLENHYIDTYTALEGYRDGVIEIDPLVSNGRLTHLGKKVLHKLRDDDAVNTIGATGDDDDDDSGNKGGTTDNDDGDGSDSGTESRENDENDEESARRSSDQAIEDESSDESDGLDAPDEKVPVDIKEPVPAFTGVDLNKYGPYDPGERATLPPTNAEVLRDQGKAQPANG